MLENEGFSGSPLQARTIAESIKGEGLRINRGAIFQILDFA